MEEDYGSAHFPATASLTPIRESWKKIQKPGTELASFLEKKSRRVWEPLGASFMEKNPKNGFFG